MAYPPKQSYGFLPEPGLSGSGLEQHFFDGLALRVGVEDVQLDQIKRRDSSKVSRTKETITTFEKVNLMDSKRGSEPS